mmetsp:Transcript_27470/g.60018  ORF Transcript_27470/g.60018 Transcript_27470/m.60018 type:complete len:392 (-) Transcript_27470:396-1571(-)
MRTQSLERIFSVENMGNLFKLGRTPSEDEFQKFLTDNGLDQQEGAEELRDLPRVASIDLLRAYFTDNLSPQQQQQQQRQQQQQQQRRQQQQQQQQLQQQRAMKQQELSGFPLQGPQVELSQFEGRQSNNLEALRAQLVSTVRSPQQRRQQPAMAPRLPAGLSVPPDANSAAPSTSPSDPAELHARRQAQLRMERPEMEAGPSNRATPPSEQLAMAPGTMAAGPVAISGLLPQGPPQMASASGAGQASVLDLRLAGMDLGRAGTQVGTTKATNMGAVPGGGPALDFTSEEMGVRRLKSIVDRMDTTTRVAIRDAFLRAAQMAEQGEGYQSMSSSPGGTGGWTRVSASSTRQLSPQCNVRPTMANISYRGFALSGSKGEPMYSGASNMGGEGS